MIAYRGLRYPEESFEAVAAQPDVGVVRDNGELTVYFVDTPANASAAAVDGESAATVDEGFATVADRKFATAVDVDRAARPAG